MPPSRRLLVTSKHLLVIPLWLLWFPCLFDTHRFEPRSLSTPLQTRVLVVDAQRNGRALSVRSPLSLLAVLRRRQRRPSHIAERLLAHANAAHRCTIHTLRDLDDNPRHGRGRGRDQKRRDGRADVLVVAALELDLVAHLRLRRLSRLTQPEACDVALLVD